MATEYLAFKGDQGLAEAVRAQVARHYLADEIVQGTYWENGHGCFIGCLVHSNDANGVTALTGFPLLLTKIAENIFEGLPAADAKEFLPRVIEAPRVGADLSLVAWKFLEWVVTDSLNQFGTESVREGCAAAVAVVAARARGEAIDCEVANTAADAAYAVAYSIGTAAGYAADAARAAASDAADAAGYAAYATGCGADVGVYAAARRTQADMLVTFLMAA